MIIKTNRLSSKNIIMMCFLSLYITKAICISLMELRFIPEVDVSVFAMVCMVGVAWLEKINILKNNMFILLYIIASIAVTLIRNDSETIDNILMAYALLIVFQYKENTIKNFIIISSLVITPFIIVKLPSAIGGEYLGNRTAIAITTIGLLIEWYLYVNKSRMMWQCTTLIICILFDLLLQSRTYLIATCISLIMLLIFRFKERLTMSRFLGCVFFVTSMIFIIMMSYQNIIELFTNKWGGRQETIFVGRSMMWIDVTSQFTWLGFVPNYTLNNWGLANVHNGFLQAYVSFGFLVFCLYVLLNLYAIYRCICLRKDEYIQGLMLVYIPVTIAAFFESNFIFELTYPFMGVVNAIYIGQILNYKNNSILKSR
ncbi:O-antigen ligase [Selenomonas ruminantium]|uniref:O-antigen ligase family protein n=1 Tax=Selenomonas ruminantium TaxID=971 RepID=UPI0026ED2614|nr:hypothetical protein [Selenomonas ruminantium]